MDIGQRIREVRDDLGMQRTVLARRVGVAENTIYRIETGKRTPSIELLESIARELRTAPAELMREPAVPLAEASATGPPGGEVAQGTGGWGREAHGLAPYATPEERRSSSRPLNSDGSGDERHSPLSPWAEYARRTAARIRRHTDDPHSPAFRDPWAALFFVEEKNHEAAELYRLLFEEEMGQEPYGGELLAAWEEPLSAFEELAEALGAARARADGMGAGRTETALDRLRQQVNAAAAKREQAAAQFSARLRRTG